MTPSPSDSRLLPRAAFRTTEWTMVLAAGRRGSAEGEAALERLCQQYWFPVYAVKPKKFSRPPEQRSFASRFGEEVEFSDLWHCQT